MLRGHPEHPIISFETIEIKMAAVSVKRTIAEVNLMMVLGVWLAGTLVHQH